MSAGDKIQRGRLHLLKTEHEIRQLLCAHLNAPGICIRG